MNRSSRNDRSMFVNLIMSMSDLRVRKGNIENINPFRFVETSQNLDANFRKS